MVNIGEVIAEIMKIDENSAPRWISQGLSSLTPEMLEQAINEWQDPLLLVEYLNLENPIIKGAARTFILKPFWERIDKTLKDPWELYNYISQNPDKKKLLDTPRGREWINYVKLRTFEYFYYFTWGRKCPSCDSEMVRKKTFSYPIIVGKVTLSNLKSQKPIVHEDYVCKGCGKIIPTVSTSEPKNKSIPVVKLIPPSRI